MSKRRIERSIDDLEAEVLEGLSADERLMLFIEAAADRNEQWLATLRDTAPTGIYHQIDPAYSELGQAAIRLLQQVVYDLHTTLLEFRLVDKMNWSNIQLGFHRDDEPTADELETAREVADTVRDRFASLYSHYHAYRRFAAEILGVDLATWVEMHPNGPKVVDHVVDELDSPMQSRLAEEYLREEGFAFDDAESELPALEALAEFRYDTLVASWEETLS